MKKCYNCQAEQPSDLTTTCIYCGYEIKETSEEDYNHHSEASSSSDTPINLDNSNGDIDIDLDIEGPEKYLGSSTESLIADDFSPIGTSEPIMPDPLDNISDPTNKTVIDESSNTSGIKKLSEEEIKSIEKELYGASNYLSDNERDKILHKFPGEERASFGNAPIEPPIKNDRNAEIKPVEMPESDLPKPKFSNTKGRGIAFFYKNYIQLVSQQHLNDEDVIVVNEREYSLKPKDLKLFKVISLSAAAALVLLVLSVSMIGGSATGYGHITGFVLDDYDQPFTDGVTISLPESGEKTKTNAQGFFQMANIPAGSHKINYLIDGEVVKSDYITVVDDEESLILLKPEPVNSYAEVEETRQEPAAEMKVKETEPEKPSEPVEKKQTTQSKTKTTKKQSTSDNYSKVSLNANVEGAKFVLDGQVIGAGNMTYSKIKPGSHNYSISLDGYEKKSGNFKVNAGENKTLSVVLSPLTNQAKQEQYSDSDYKYSAKAAFAEGNYKTTISDISSFLKNNPGDPEAYSLRADAYEYVAQPDKAYDDYIRAAEIFMFQKDYYSSITNYSSAIEIDKKSTTAYLGRAKAYLAKNEPLAAMADFDFVVKLDRRNFEAYYGLGEATFAQQRYKTAIDHFKDARAIDGNNPLVYQYLMLSYLAVDDHKNLKKSFDKFKDVASDKDIKNLYKNPKYSAALKIIEMD